ncbi:hypothetical protein HNP84_002934 [Thermocatellispora tengchongensis]|uniref:DUF4439 domain-containing protein n=1 Tax=Thermocatellispora tengchongensis TaxID=1073253 RepID=A0A840P5N1_9ACTN|nr:ferritin-like domain-containing protein [Thermocatellispora tengchongensis]MBB5133213.1 hypothetical protein [Thermocatellispora tengchongensis]
MTGSYPGAQAAAYGPVAARAGTPSGPAAKDTEGPVKTLDGLMKALAAEHAAVFAYALIAARATGARKAAATAAYNAHRGRRDQLRGLIRARGGTPAEPEASYALPFTPRDSTEGARLAALVEDGVTAVYLELAACDDPATRRTAALAMQEAAARAYGFRPTIAALPGFPGPDPEATATTPGPTATLSTPSTPSTTATPS